MDSVQKFNTGSGRVKIRNATFDDIPALMILEQKCWKVPLQIEEKVIRERISKHSAYQWVAVDENDILLGVLYTQKISGVENLIAGSFQNESELHTEDGNIILLCAINIARGNLYSNEHSTEVTKLSIPC